jgi:hypothetical protein
MYLQRTSPSKDARARHGVPSFVEQMERRFISIILLVDGALQWGCSVVTARNKPVTYVDMHSVRRHRVHQRSMELCNIRKSYRKS